MTEKTIIVPSLGLTYQGRFSLSAIEDVIKKYMHTTEYELTDVSHDMTVREHNKNHTMTFMFTHHPYTQEECRLRISITAENSNVVSQKMPSGVHEFYDGTLKVAMRATTYSNADDYKHTKALPYVVSTLFRKYVFDTGNNDVGNEMKKYCYDLYDQIYGLVNIGKSPEGINA